MQNLPKRLPLKLTKFELRVTPNGSCGITSAYRSCGRPQTGAFEGAAALLMAMFATGVLGDDALKKTPSSEDESEKSAKCAVGLGLFNGGLESFVLALPLVPRNLQTGSPTQCP